MAIQLASQALTFGNELGSTGRIIHAGEPLIIYNSNENDPECELGQPIHINDSNENETECAKGRKFSYGIFYDRRDELDIAQKNWDNSSLEWMGIHMNTPVYNSVQKSMLKSRIIDHHVDMLRKETQLLEFKLAEVKIELAEAKKKMTAEYIRLKINKNTVDTDIAVKQSMCKHKNNIKDSTSVDTTMLAILADVFYKGNYDPLDSTRSEKKMTVNALTMLCQGRRETIAYANAGSGKKEIKEYTREKRDVIICKMCIKQNEVEYYCQTCKMKICNFCHYFHEEVRQMSEHKILLLV